jgi:hypothetical protein
VAADILIDIELDLEGEEEDDGGKSIFSRSSRGKKSSSKQSNRISKFSKNPQ